jgi:TfoX/Sxy family transcriptional regulator of competence genes
VKRKVHAVRKAPPSRRPPPLHQGTLDEAVARLGLRDVAIKPLFGGLCYYVSNKPFAILLGASLALKLPATQLRQSCAQGDGELFHPGGGDFIMREYLDLSEGVLMDEGQVDSYVQASYRFIAGQGISEGELNWGDLLQGRAELYKQAKRKPGKKDESTSVKD